MLGFFGVSMWYKIGKKLGAGALKSIQKIEGLKKRSAQAAQSLVFIEPEGEVAEVSAQLFVKNVEYTLNSLLSLTERKERARMLFEDLKLSKTKELLILKLSALAIDLGPNKESIHNLLKDLEIESLEISSTENKLREALYAPRSELLRLWLSLSGGVDCLIWLRQTVLCHLKEYPFLKALEKELKHLLSDIFAQGLLTHQIINWNSPAIILENVMAYEQVHKMESWADLKPRLGEDRRIHAFFHSAWVSEPVSFVEIALTQGICGNMDDILKGKRIAPKTADTAMFYSINSPHAGLRGISFGEELIKASIDSIKKEFPNIKNFCTLSPIPSFVKWLEKQSSIDLEKMVGSVPKRLHSIALKTLPTNIAYIKQTSDGKQHLVIHVGQMLDMKWNEENEILFSFIYTKLAAKYLTLNIEGFKHKDPVARFHLGNGAQIEQIRFNADKSQNGWGQARGVMVNYLYDLDALEEYKKEFQNGRVSTSLKFKWQTIYKNDR